MVVDVYAYEFSASRTVYLIDTPGFDDTSRSDTEVLREIAGWLTASYSNKVLLHGIIYLHRITDVRMQGSAKKNLLMFKKLCGNDALQKVVLTTTMWDKVPHGEAEDREQQLVNTPEFWGFMVSKGSNVYRHNNTVESAIRIIKALADGSSTVTLDLQNQMVNQNQTLNETAAGRELESELIKERQKWVAELKDVQEQMKEAIRLRDKESEQALRELKDDYTTRMERLERDNKQLHIDAERLRDVKIQSLEEAFEKQSKEHAKNLKELKLKNFELENATKLIDKISSPIVELESKHSKATEIFEYTERRSSPRFSASLYAEHYTFVGPESWEDNIMSAEAYEKLKGFDICFSVCGTGDAWVYKFITDYGESKIFWSSNLKVQYPKLYEKLKSCAHDKVLWICLGPNQTYFLTLDGCYHYWLTPAVSSIIREVLDRGEYSANITAVALGIDDTYVIVQQNNIKWDLKGYYLGLAAILNRSTSAPRLVALNSHSRNDFLILKSALKFDLYDAHGHESLENIWDWMYKNGVADLSYGSR